MHFWDLHIKCWWNQPLNFHDEEEIFQCKVRTTNNFKCLRERKSFNRCGWWGWWKKISISNFSLFLFFHPLVNFINSICTNFSYESHFSSYVLALLKNSYEKCVCILLMKLTPVVNFINKLWAHFSYESALRSFSLVTFWLCIFLSQNYWRKRCT